MTESGSLQWTAKVAKSNIWDLIHSFQQERIGTNLALTQKPDCPHFDHFSTDTHCTSCPKRSTCEEYSQWMKQRLKDTRNISALRTHLIETTGNEDLHHQNSRGMILCYLALHLLHPSEDGLCRDVSFSFLAKLTGLAVSTVRKCMQDLQDRHYILFSNQRYDIEYGLYDFKITSYFKAFLSAHVGGRGYVHIDAETWKALCVLPVNELRVSLLALCDADRADNDSGSTSVRYREYAKYLPGYFCRTVFDKLLNRLSDNEGGLFHLVGSAGKDHVLAYREGMNARKRFKDSRVLIQKDLASYCTQVDSCLDQLRFGYSPLPVAGKIKALCDKKVFTYEKKEPSLHMIEDMVSVCVDYSVDLVKNAYLHLISRGVNVKKDIKAGAKLRDICKELTTQSSSSLQAT